MHKHRAHAHAPQRCGADAIGARVVALHRELFPVHLRHASAVVLRHRHNDAIAGTDVVQQEVAVGVKGLVAERGGNHELAAVDLRACRCCGQRRNMADVAADLGEQRLALADRRGRGLAHVARRTLCGAHETREVIDVGEPIRPALVIRLSRRVTQIGHFVGLQRVGDAHLIEVSIGREG